MSGLLGSLAQWVVDVVYASGYVGVTLLVASGYLHLPIPTQVTLPLTGFLVGQGRFSFIPALLWTTVGAVAASLVLYFPGRWIGEEPVRRFVRRFGRFVFVYESDLNKASDLFERHSGKAVLIGHFIPGVTAFISIPAGIKRMRIYGKFLFYTVIGCVVWNGVFITLGWALGHNWTLVERYAPIVEWAVLGVIALVILWFLWRRWRANR